MHKTQATLAYTLVGDALGQCKGVGKTLGRQSEFSLQTSYITDHIGPLLNPGDIGLKLLGQ